MPIVAPNRSHNNLSSRILVVQPSMVLTRPRCLMGSFNFQTLIDTGRVSSKGLLEESFQGLCIIEMHGPFWVENLIVTCNLPSDKNNDHFPFILLNIPHPRRIISHPVAGAEEPFEQGP